MPCPLLWISISGSRGDGSSALHCKTDEPHICLVALEQPCFVQQDTLQSKSESGHFDPFHYFLHIDCGNPAFSIIHVMQAAIVAVGIPSQLRVKLGASVACWDVVSGKPASQLEKFSSMRKYLTKTCVHLKCRVYFSHVTSEER